MFQRWHQRLSSSFLMQMYLQKHKYTHTSFPPVSFLHVYKIEHKHEHARAHTHTCSYSFISIFDLKSKILKRLRVIQLISQGFNSGVLPAMPPPFFPATQDIRSDPQIQTCPWARSSEIFGFKVSWVQRHEQWSNSQRRRVQVVPDTGKNASQCL